MNSLNIYSVFLLSLLSSISKCEKMLETISTVPELSMLNEILQTQELSPIRDILQSAESDTSGKAITFFAPSNEVLNQFTPEDKDNMLRTLSEYIVPQSVECASRRHAAPRVEILKTLNLEISDASSKSPSRILEYTTSPRGQPLILCGSEKQILLKHVSRCQSPSKVLIVTEKIPKAVKFSEVLSSDPEISRFREMLASYQLIEEVEQLPPVMVHALKNEHMQTFMETLETVDREHTKEYLRSKLIVPLTANPVFADEWKQRFVKTGVMSDMIVAENNERELCSRPIEALENMLCSPAAQAYERTPNLNYENQNRLNEMKNKEFGYISEQQYPKEYLASAVSHKIISKKMFENGVMMLLDVNDLLEEHMEPIMADSAEHGI